MAIYMPAFKTETLSEFARMYPQDKYQNLVATSTIVAVPVCVFLFIVSIFLMNLLVAQLSQSYHDAYSNMQAGHKVGTGCFWRCKA